VGLLINNQSSGQLVPTELSFGGDGACHLWVKIARQRKRENGYGYGLQGKLVEVPD
jgi:hypothetical protein